MVDYEIYTLNNGIRILYKQVTNTKIAHCGFMLDIGSRDENEDNQGIAHFWEHMAFKGTTKRKSFHILNRIDSVGGELNAYTTKEKVAFYASVLDNHVEKAVELLSDITFDSIFPEKQIEKERNVILEEMAMYHDTPDDSIQDEFDKVVFGNHPLGMNILGTTESVNSFSRNDFKEFVKDHMDTERLVFCMVGNIPHKKVQRLVDKYISPVPRQVSKLNRKPFLISEPKIQEERRSISQAHCAIGRTAYSMNDNKRIPFFLLTNILGGPGMNSRLNLALREKYGFVYSIDANYQSYIDTGLFGVFFATEAKHLRRSTRLVYKEFQRLREKALGTMQLHAAKEQIMGQLAMAEENNTSMMLMMGKSMLDINRIDSLEHVFNMIRKVSASDLQDIANEMLNDDQLSMLTYVPD